MIGQPNIFLTKIEYVKWSSVGMVSVITVIILRNRHVNTHRRGSLGSINRSEFSFNLKKSIVSFATVIRIFKFFFYLAATVHSPNLESLSFHIQLAASVPA